MATVASAVAGAAMFSSAIPAAAANPPFSGCPTPAVCLYKDSGGTGSKKIIDGNFSSGTLRIVDLAGLHFLDGSPANNEVSSWKNNTNCILTFIDDPQSDSPLIIGSSGPNTFGQTGDFGGNATFNDKLSRVQINCL